LSANTFLFDVAALLQGSLCQWLSKLSLQLGAERRQISQP
jgi:hypothetical protein